MCTIFILSFSIYTFGEIFESRNYFFVPHSFQKHTNICWIFQTPYCTKSYTQVFLRLFFFSLQINNGRYFYGVFPSTALFPIIFFILKTSSRRLNLFSNSERVEINLSRASFPYDNNSLKIQIQTFPIHIIKLQSSGTYRYFASRGGISWCIIVSALAIYLFGLTMQKKKPHKTVRFEFQTNKINYYARLRKRFILFLRVDIVFLVLTLNFHYRIGRFDGVLTRFWVEEIIYYVSVSFGAVRSKRKTKLCVFIYIFFFIRFDVFP